MSTRVALSSRRSNASDRKECISVLVVGGMHSGTCVTRIEKALRSLPGVTAASTNLLTRMATVRHSANVQPHHLVQALSAVGYEATPAGVGGDPRTREAGQAAQENTSSLKARLVTGAVLTAMLFVVDRCMGGDSKNRALWMFLLATPVQITVGWAYYMGFFRALRRFSFNMDSLVAIGATAAYGQGVLSFIGAVGGDPALGKWYPLFLASCAILTLVTLGRYLESRARESGTKLYGNLMQMMPAEARVLRDGREQVIPAGVVAVGDTVVVKAGEKIPVDGIVMEGSSQVNEALLTGEGRPEPKVKGDRVIVASVNGGGTLKIRATGVGDSSTLAQISRLVADAQTQKAPVQLLADRISAIFVPIVILLAIATFFIWYLGPYAAQHYLSAETLKTLAGGWFDFLTRESSLPSALRPMIAVLVAACPCALGLASPAVVLVATGLGARRGILIKGGQAIEAAGRVTDVLFDKTGILTTGTYRTRAVLTAEGISREDLMNLAGSLEACSEHPLAKSVIVEAKKSTVVLKRVEDFEALPGRGLRGRIGGKDYLLGSRTLMDDHEVAIRGELGKAIAKAEAAGATTTFLADANGRLLGAIALSDEVRASAPEALDDLRDLGLNVHLLSGDHPGAAKAVGKRCGLEPGEIHAGMDTEEKIEFTLELKRKGHRVAMIGDGVNDAPAMAAADVGLALGTGTDLSVEAGAIVLVGDDPRGVARALLLCHEALRLIRWNLVWAFSFNAVMIPLAALDRLDIGVAAAAAAASSILVVVNGLRLTEDRVDLNAVLGEPTIHPSAEPSAALATHTPVDMRSLRDR